MSTMCLPIRNNGFYKFPKTSWMIFVYSMCKFVNNYIIDNRFRSHDESPWEIEIIVSTTGTPSGSGTIYTNLSVRKPTFFCKIFNSFGQVDTSLFSVPIGKCENFCFIFLDFSRETEKTFWVDDWFFLCEIVFEWIRCSKITESIAFFFFLLFMSSKMFSYPIRFLVYEGIDNIFWNRKWSAYNESFFAGNLNGDRTSRCADDFKMRYFLHYLKKKKDMFVSYGFSLVNQGKLLTFSANLILFRIFFTIFFFHE